MIDLARLKISKLLIKRNASYKWNEMHVKVWMNTCSYLADKSCRTSEQIRFWFAVSADTDDDFGRRWRLCLPRPINCPGCIGSIVPGWRSRREPHRLTLLRQLTLRNTPMITKPPSSSESFWEWQLSVALFDSSSVLFFIFGHLFVVYDSLGNIISQFI